MAQFIQLYNLENYKHDEVYLNLDSIKSVHQDERGKARITMTDDVEIETDIDFEAWEKIAKDITVNSSYKRSQG